jgi:hypothetical protein
VSKLYKGASAVRFYYSTGNDITGATLTTLEVTYPGGSTASWTCTVDTASTGSFYYDLATTSTLKTVGSYLIQAKVVFTDDTEAWGDTEKFKVYDQFK